MAAHIQKNIFHVAVVAPLFLYVGFCRDKTPDWVFTLLGVLGVVILLYHSYQAYTKMHNGQSSWVNWIHILLIVPLLLLLGYLKKDANRRYFEMLLLLGFAALGYHGLYLIRETMFH
jgi:L-asparagine transporter-like permease